MAATVVLSYKLIVVREITNVREYATYMLHCNKKALIRHENSDGSVTLVQPGTQHLHNCIKCSVPNLG